MDTKPPTARALAREAVHASIILAAARARLTEEGPSQLALRAVARDVGMVSSAVYRTSRVGTTCSPHSSSSTTTSSARPSRRPTPPDRADVTGRWRAACRAIRSWAVAHPGDFALLYGSPVPGYVAPRETIEPASRTTHVLVQVVVDAWTAGRHGARPAPTSAPGDLTPAIGDAAAYLRERGFADDLPDELVLRTLMAWTTVFGVVSFELFGHAVGSVSDAAAYFDHVVARLADDLGISERPSAGVG